MLFLSNLVNLAILDLLKEVLDHALHYDLRHGSDVGALVSDLL